MIFEFIELKTILFTSFPEKNIGAVFNGNPFGPVAYLEITRFAVWLLLLS